MSQQGSTRRAVTKTVKFALDQLPPSYRVHWSAKRKAQVVDAIEGGLIRLEDALDRYRMSMEEYHSWRQDLRRRQAQRVGNVLAFGRRRIERHKTKREADARPPV